MGHLVSLDADSLERYKREGLAVDIVRSAVVVLAFVDSPNW